MTHCDQNKPAKQILSKISDLNLLVQPLLQPTAERSRWTHLCLHGFVLLVTERRFTAGFHDLTCVKLDICPTQITAEILLSPFCSATYIDLKFAVITQFAGGVTLTPNMKQRSFAIPKA